MVTLEGEWDDRDGYEHEWESRNDGKDEKDRLGRKLREIDAGLRCSICRGFLTVPVSTPCCHSFCSQCIRSALHCHTVGSQKCPVCARPAAPTTLRALPQLGKLIQTFRNLRPLLLNEVKAGGEKLRCGNEYRLPVRNIDSMSMVNCRKLMKKYGLPEDGSKEDMKVRYRALELKVNSEVDRCPGRIPSAQTLARMAKDVEYNERKRINTKNEICRSKTRHYRWLENVETGGVCVMDNTVKADYRRLIDQAKASKVSGHTGAAAADSTTATSSSLSLEKDSFTDINSGREIKLYSCEEEVMGVAGQWIPYSSSPWSFSIPENCTPFFYNSDTREWQLEVPEHVEADRRRLFEGIDSRVSHHMCFIPTHKFLTVVSQNPSHQYSDSTMNENLDIRNLAAASDPHSATQDSLLEKSRGVGNDGAIVSSVYSSPRNHTAPSSSESTGMKSTKVLNNVDKPSDSNEKGMCDDNGNESGKGSIQHDNTLNNTTSDSTTTGEAASECIETRSGDTRNCNSDLAETIWECTSCTFHNTKMDAISCDICRHPRLTSSNKLKSNTIQGRKRQTTIVGISMGHKFSKRQKSAK